MVKLQEGKGDSKRPFSMRLFSMMFVIDATSTLNCGIVATNLCYS